MFQFTYKTVLSQERKSVFAVRKAKVHLAVRNGGEHDRRGARERKAPHSKVHKGDDCHANVSAMQMSSIAD